MKSNYLYHTLIFLAIIFGALDLAYGKESNLAKYRKLDSELTRVKAEREIANAPKAIVVKESTNYYTVAQGDGWYAIARKNNCRIKDLLSLNNKPVNYLLHTGEKILLPSSAKPERKALSTAAEPKKEKVAAAEKPSKQPSEKPSKTASTPKLASNNAKPAPKTATPKPAAPKHEVAKHEEAKPKPVAKAEVKNFTPNTAKQIDKVKLNQEMSFGDLANKYGTDVKRLNDINGLDLTCAVILARGTELYVPAQP